MLMVGVAALAWLCVVRGSPASEPHALRAHLHSSHMSKELSSILSSIEERLRTLDTISTAQAAYGRRLDVIQDKLDRVETTLSLRLERAQLAAEKLEYRLHMLQTHVQATIEDSSKQLEQSQEKVSAVATNLTNYISSHRHLLEKVSGSYVETWRRGLTLEKLMKDGLSLINATRREMADGIRTLARRQRDARLTSTYLEAAFTRRLNDNTNKIDLKMKEMLETQKHFVDSCQRVQQDQSSLHIADVIGKLIDNFMNKTATIFHEIQNIHTSIRSHDAKVTKIVNSARTQQSDATCRRLESVFRNATQSTAKESELQQLIEKFVALTDRADAAIQRLESRLIDDGPTSYSDATDDADRLLLKLKGLKSEQDQYEDWEDEDQDSGYFDDDGGDLIDYNLINNSKGDRSKVRQTKVRHTTSAPHRRHLHKHPYDRGPVPVK